MQSKTGNVQVSTNFMPAFDPKTYPLTDQMAKDALGVSQVSLDDARYRNRIRKSLVLQSPSGKELWYYNTIDLVEFRLFTDILMESGDFYAPASIIQISRGCCKVLSNKMPMYRNRQMSGQQMITSFMNSMDDHWNIPTDCSIDERERRKRRYAGYLLEFSLKNWRKMTERVEIAFEVKKSQYIRYLESAGGGLA